MTGARPHLRALAGRLGIVEEYIDQSGRERRLTSDETRVLLLRALGHEAEEEDDAREALERLEREDAARLLAPARVVIAGSEAARDLALRVASRAGAHIAWRAWLRIEGADDEEWSPLGEGQAARDADGLVRLRLPELPELGYHTLRLEIAGRRAEQMLIVVPDRCMAPESLLQGRPVFGVIANLYAVRSERNWGVGDIGDLAKLLEWTAEVGGAFVGVNPLHTLRNRGADVSPYSPVSRLYRNVLYLDVEAVPELADSPELHAALRDPAFVAERQALRQTTQVDYERVMAVKRPLLERLHRIFRDRHQGRDDARGRAYAAYVRDQGETLDDFATFLAIDETMAASDPAPASWNHWPATLRDVHGDAVREFRDTHAALVDFHRWLQFELDRQLGEVAARAERAGMPIGVYQDLAIGTAGDSADTWMFPELFVRGVSIGAPPDLLAAQGQIWSLPPMHPQRLVETGYRYWIALVRSSLRHAGALRIDHALGLFRQFWIPEGKDGREGAYIRFPTADLLGILALESRRHAALIVGEDLGTVPPEVPEVLKRWNVLGSKVLYFERDAKGFHPAAHYEPLALTTANTHDMPTLAGFWMGRDIELRESTGLIDADEAGRAVGERAVERRMLAERLTLEGLLPPGAIPATPEELSGIVHTFLRRTPSWLVGHSLDDLTAETEPINMPGLTMDRFPAWRRRSSRTIESLRGDPRVHRALGEGREWRREARPGE